jgi:hypothetical protein
MGNIDIIERVLNERQNARIESLRAALEAIANRYDDSRSTEPEDFYLADERNDSRYDIEVNAFDAGKQRREWEIGKEAQTALNEWERTA